MRTMSRLLIAITVCFVCAARWGAADAPKAMPPPADHRIDFTKEIKPLFEAACINCHAKGKNKGGFSLEKRESFLKGGDPGPAAVAGQSAKPLLGRPGPRPDPDPARPQKAPKRPAA